MSQKGIFSGSLPMKKKYVSLILLIATCLAILSSMPTRASAQESRKATEKPKWIWNVSATIPNVQNTVIPGSSLQMTFRNFTTTIRPGIIVPQLFSALPSPSRKWPDVPTIVRMRKTPPPFSNNWQKNIPQAFWPTTRYIGRRSSATNSCATPERPAIFW